MMYRFLIAVGVAIVASSAEAKSEVVHHVGSFPEVGAVVTISVGDEMFANFDYYARVVAIPQGAVDGTYMLAPLKIAPGEELTPTKSKRGFMACGKEKDIDEIALFETTDPTCLIDENRDGTFDRSAPIGLIDKGKRLRTPIPYSLVEMPIPQAKPSKMTIVFSGMQDGSMLLEYRPHPDRPGTELRLPLKAGFPQHISVRGKRFTVHSINEGDLTYSLIP